MFTCGLCNRYIKHASLVTACYPITQGERKPRSSELSYLTFYASSRPAKLTKVGGFLEKKVQQDIYKGRKMLNLCSLEILNALLTSCYHDLNLFSKSTVNIIDMVLDTRDEEMIKMATSTYSTFAKYHNGSTIGVDADLTRGYEELITKWAQFTVYKNADEEYSRHMRQCGLLSIYATIASPAFFASNSKTQIQIILPNILANLVEEGEKENGLNNLNKQLEATGENPEIIEDVPLLALKVLHLLFRKCDAANLRFAMGPVFKFLDDNDKWWPRDFGVSLATVLVSAIQPQWRFNLVSELLDHLNSSPRPRTPNPTASISGSVDTSATVVPSTVMESPSRKSATLVSMLAAILTSRLTLAGLSILEVLNTLLGNLIRFLRGTKYSGDDELEGEKADLENSEKISEAIQLERIVHRGLVSCIGGLSTHIYYTNQMSDITSHLLSKLRPNTGLTEFDGIPIVELRRVLLRCLLRVVENYRESRVRVLAELREGSKEGADTKGNAAPDELMMVTGSVEGWAASLSFLADRDLETRLMYTQTLTTFLYESPIDSKTISTKLLYLTKPNHDFLTNIHGFLVDKALMPDLTPLDVVAILGIMRGLLIRFGNEAVIRGVPVMFKLQSLVKDGIIEDTPKQRALATATLLYFEMVGTVFETSRLTEYVAQLKETRIIEHQLTPSISYDLPPETLSSLPPTLEDLEPPTNPTSLVPIDRWIDRHTVVDILIRDESLLTKSPDLERRLYHEFGSDDSSGWSNSQFRIRVSRNLDDIKPRLVTPMVMTIDEQPEFKRINVENLKEALSHQTSNTDSDLDSDSLPSITLSTVKKAKEPRSDLSALLNAIGNHNGKSTTSLANPPYKGV